MHKLTHAHTHRVLQHRWLSNLLLDCPCHECLLLQTWIWVPGSNSSEPQVPSHNRWHFCFWFVSINKTLLMKFPSLCLHLPLFIGRQVKMDLLVSAAVDLWLKLDMGNSHLDSAAWWGEQGWAGAGKAFRFFFLFLSTTGCLPKQSHARQGLHHWVIYFLTGHRRNFWVFPVAATSPSGVKLEGSFSEASFA